MTTDDAGHVAEPELDIEHLPNILNVKLERMRFDPPRLHVAAGQESWIEEAQCVTIETDGEFPVRSAAPVLFVGDVPLTESEAAGDNYYRFLVLHDEQLAEGATIGLGWSGIPEPMRTTDFKLGRCEESHAEEPNG